MRTWTHVVGESFPWLLAECPDCHVMHALANPPIGVLRVSIDHHHDSCAMYVDGVHAMRLGGEP